MNIIKIYYLIRKRMNYLNLLKHYNRSYVWRVFILIPLILFVLICSYGILVILGATIPVNNGRKALTKGEQIYLVNNGYHIALVLPRDACPYRDLFDIPLNLSEQRGFFYFGWGERQFYLGTPTVRKMDWSMALNALFTPGSAVLEVLYINKIASDHPGVTSIPVTEDELSYLYEYVKESFMKSGEIPKQIPTSEIDQAFQGSIFFEANGTYSLFNTCNNWTSMGLKQAGLNTHLWTPFTWGVE
jgi:uncharacterized protein (TIGR02117 family)